MPVKGSGLKTRKTGTTRVVEINAELLKKRIETLPTDLLAQQVLSKYFTYNEGKNLSKMLKHTTHGLPLQQQYQKVVPQWNAQECLEAIYLKYPFLPREGEASIDTYIHLRESPFQSFARDCIPNHFPLQIKRCCFRIEYNRAVFDSIFHPQKMDLNTKEGMERLKGMLRKISETIYLRGSGYLWGSKNVNMINSLYDVLFDLIRGTSLKKLERKDVEEIIDILHQKNFVIPDYIYGYNRVQRRKQLLFVQLVQKVLPLQSRKDLVMDNKKKWSKMLKNYKEFLNDLLYWQRSDKPHVQTFYKLWNTFILQKTDLLKNKVNNKRVFSDYVYSLLHVIRSGLWNEYADYYAYFLPYLPKTGISPTLMMELLDAIPIHETWMSFFYYAKNSGQVSKKKLDKILVDTFKKYLKHMADTLKNNVLEKLVGLYKLFHKERGDQDHKILLPLLIKTIMKHKLIKDAKKEAVQQYVLSMI
jgi:hypothetical protein